MLSCSDKDKTDWSVSFDRKHKKPYGTYILYEEINSIIPNQEKVVVTKNIHDFLNDHYSYYDDQFDINGSYIFINKNMNKMDTEGANALLNFVASGNDAFIASNSFNSVLLDSLGIEGYTSANPFLYIESTATKNLTKKEISLVNPDFNPKSYSFKKQIKSTHFTILDTLNTTVLGTQKIKDTVQINFVKIPYHGGTFYLHSQPILFTNYHIRNQQDYSAQVLSYLPNKTIYWDANKRYRKNGDDNTSMLSLFLSKESLRWASLLTLISLLIFVLFNAKRKQRTIPIIKPLENTTLDFTQTIGNLYYQQKNHGEIIQQKIIFFLEKIRNDYLLDTQNLNKEFIERLSTKSNRPLGEVTLLINTILKLNKQQHLNSEDDLLRLNQLIEKFFDNATKES